MKMKIERPTCLTLHVLHVKIPGTGYGREWENWGKFKVRQLPGIATVVF